MAAVNLSPPHFPDDILIEIFLKLPVSSLIIFRTVCKNWLHLIQSPNFIHMHLNHPINDHNSVLVIHEIYDHSSKWKKILTLMSASYNEDVPLEALSPSMVCRGLIGPCNGLFCLTDGSDIVVFNPVARQCRQVPHSPSRNDYRVNYFHRFCFGFDSVSNEYKIVDFNEIDLREADDDDDDDDDTSSDNSSDACYRVEISIFSLSTNSWTQVDDCVGPTRYMSAYSSNATFFNGAFHWFCYSNCRTWSIVAFDLNKEAFKQFELPGYFARHYLSVLDEYMAIVAWSETDCLSHQKDEIEIWVMKEYGVYNSWTKLYNIDIGAVLNIRRIFPFSKDGEFLSWDYNGELVSFNFNTRVIKRLGIFEDPWYALRFRESLVSPGRF